MNNQMTETRPVETEATDEQFLTKTYIEEGACDCGTLSDDVDHDDDHELEGPQFADLRVTLQASKTGDITAQSVLVLREECIGDGGLGLPPCGFRYDRRSSLSDYLDPDDDMEGGQVEELLKWLREEQSTKGRPLAQTSQGSTGLTPLKLTRRAMSVPGDAESLLLSQ